MSIHDGRSAESFAETRASVIRVVICGEVSSGKSTVLNALLRQPVFPDNIGQVRRPFIVAGHRAQPGIEILREDGEILEMDRVYDPDLLRDSNHVQIYSDRPHIAGFELIEVPMTTAEDLTQAQIMYVRSADILIWVTIASQAWRLTEKTILERLGDARPKRAIIAVSRADKLRSTADRDRIRSRVERESAPFFDACTFISGSRPEIERSESSDEAWDKTGGAEVLAALKRLASQTDAPSPAKPPAVIADAPEKEPEPDQAPEQMVEAAQDADSEQQPQPEPALQDEATETGAPDPAPHTKARKPATDRRKAKVATRKPSRIKLNSELRGMAAEIEGAMVIGLAPEERDRRCEVYSGNARYCQSVADACRAALDRLSNAYPEGGEFGEVRSAALCSRSRNLIYQEIPGTGLLFVMGDSSEMSLGSARTALTRLCRRIESFG